MRCMHLNTLVIREGVLTCRACGEKNPIDPFDGKEGHDKIHNGN